MISDLVQHLGVRGGGGWRLTNTNFYSTTFRVQDFALHIDLFFFVLNSLKKNIFFVCVFSNSMIKKKKVIGYFIICSVVSKIL